MFKCDKCGQCCRSLNMNPIYKDLDRGDGTCKFLEGNLCSIYENRPLICRVDDAYEEFFVSIMTKEEYYEINTKICKALKTKERSYHVSRKTN